ncbi:hypothetical protein [Tumebacillus permanentifrigoris]|uniref:Uncharacterized protein n=1 Tax=Tumebacillus permanentifrigoris TaxID=378543 RepID=A0A316DAY6_9BACL|nr:hypothetical protein [Tumebacillus permanentifrigoris]PWK14262.1 hypothetical protein C7459_10515 [Tumebacillus permanentifrigoris]
MKEIAKCLSIGAIILSISMVSILPANASPNVPLASVKASQELALSKNHVPKVLSQKEINNMMGAARPMTGVVFTSLANQIRTDFFCYADPTVYNFGFDPLIDFVGLVNIYRETGFNTGQYAYVVSASANEGYIPAAFTSGFDIKTLSYSHWGYRMFWQFNSSYQVPGNAVVTVSPAYANF